MQRETREDRRRRTRERLLDAATEVFARRGIERASLDEVAAAAGLTKGAVYSNFDSKEDLVLALFRRHVETPDDPRAGGEDAAQRLAAYARLGDDFAEALGTRPVQDWAVLIVDFWVYGMRNPSARQLLRTVLRTTRELSGQDMPADTGPEFSREERATLAVALNVGLALQHLADPERVPAELYGRALRLVHEGRVDPGPPEASTSSGR